MKNKFIKILCILAVIFINISVLKSINVYAAEVSPSECLECHGEKDIEPETKRGKKLKLHVDSKMLKGSVHQELACTDCHSGEKTWSDAPHNEGKPLKFNCKKCHMDVDDEYEKSIHGISSSHGDKMAATCYNCHGGHNVLPASDRKSMVNKFNLHKTCATCHTKKKILQTRKISKKEAVSQFVDSIHGRALLKDGLIVAPSCNDCHGVHDILPHTHPDSKISRERVPDTCGKCHVLVEEIYNKSIHGQLVKDHDIRGPICISCHSSHTIGEPTTQEFKLHSDATCGKCHQDRLANYRETFHGRALALGRKEVATCYDCHGHHDIVKKDNPESYISKKNIVKTCAKCHPDANENFAGFIVHADHNDKERYPILYYTFWFMTILLLSTFGIFLLHTLLWMFRTFALFRGDSKEWLEQKLKIKKDTEMYVRFRPLERFLHALVIFSFLLAVITGMPIKFYYTDWAKTILSMMGGQEVAAVMHRFAAIITCFYFATHVISVLVAFSKQLKKFKNPETGKTDFKQVRNFIFGPESLMPHMQDIKDIIAHNKWFFGKGPKPQFGRWTYWEKFDYLAVFWGVAVIGGSGFILWFPEFFTKLLPGWSINVAMIIHSDEALLAAGFIFAFHFFNVHFRPEKFPMDSCIFSGRISKEEMLHERRRQWDQWERDGVTEQYKMKDEWEAWKWIVLPGGFIAFCIGLILVILIFTAMFSRLAGG